MTRKLTILLTLALLASGCAGSKAFRHGQDAVFAKQSIHLHPEREECDQVNATERTEKPAARHEVGWLADVVAPEQTREKRSGPAMFGDKTVSRFSYDGESREMLITPGHPFAAGFVT